MSKLLLIKDDVIAFENDDKSFATFQILEDGVLRKISNGNQPRILLNSFYVNYVKRGDR